MLFSALASDKSSGGGLLALVLTSEVAATPSLLMMTHLFNKMKTPLFALFAKFEGSQIHLHTSNSAQGPVEQQYTKPITCLLVDC